MSRQNHQRISLIFSRHTFNQNFFPTTNSFTNPQQAGKMTQRLILFAPLITENQQNDSQAETCQNLKNPENITKPIEAKSNVLFSQITKRCVSGKTLFYSLPASNSMNFKKALFPKRFVAKSSSPHKINTPIPYFLPSLCTERDRRERFTREEREKEFVRLKQKAGQLSIIP